MILKNTVAIALTGSLALSACSTTNSELLKVYDGGAYEHTATLSAKECQGISKNLNRALTERGSVFVCIEVPK